MSSSLYVSVVCLDICRLNVQAVVGKANADVLFWTV